VRYLSLF